MTNSELIVNNINLVHACAQKFKNRGIEYDDLFQAGCLGLTKSINSFDANRGVKISTYAVPFILGEIKKLFRDGGSIKISRALKKLSLKATQFVNDFFVQNAKEPSINELAEGLNVDPFQAVQALEASKLPISLTVTNDDSSDTNQLDIPTESIEKKLSDTIALRQIIGKLNKLDKKLIFLRFFKNKTQTQTAEMLNVTQVQISRRERQILKNLRLQLDD